MIIMEPKPIYITEAQQETLVECPVCHAVIGAYVRQGRRVLMRIGPLTLYAVHGVCTGCGEPYHFTSSEKMLESLIERVKKNRNG
jgi:hypothetical protein